MALPGLAIGAIAAPVIGGIIGANQANKDRKAADQQRAAALAQFANLSLPEIENLKLELERYGNAGNLSPEMVQLITQGDTDLANVSTDPRLRASQERSLAGLEELATRGISAADQAGFDLARRQSAAEAQAKQNQILQNLQQRGQGGSGAELAASLANAQSGADRLQQAQLEEAKARQAARQAALLQQSQAAGNLRTQDYNELSNVAQARDQIARFNAQNAQNVNQTNVGAKNQAQQFNLTNAQRIRDANTGLSNTQQQYNKNLAVDDYNRRFGLAGARANALTGNAVAAEQRAAQTAGLFTDVGSSIGKGLLGLASGSSSEKPKAGG